MLEGQTAQICSINTELFPPSPQASGIGARRLRTHRYNCMSRTFPEDLRFKAVANHSQFIVSFKKNPYR